MRWIKTLLRPVNRWAERRSKRKYCMHHDIRGCESYIASTIIDYRKLFLCTGCGRTWII